MRKLLPIFLGVVWLSASGYASASAMLTVEGGQLVSAWGVEVDGRVLDVAFVDGTCIDMFDGCDEDSDFFFGGDQAGARAASQALLGMVFQGPFDSSPSLTNGCTSGICGALTPFTLASPFVRVVTAQNTGQVLDPPVGLLLVNRESDLSSNAFQVWAVWSESVPEPSSLLLTGLGLGLVGATRRRKRETVSV